MTDLAKVANGGPVNSPDRTHVGVPPNDPGVDVFPTVQVEPITREAWEECVRCAERLSRELGRRRA